MTALLLGAILLVVVIATASKGQNPAIGTPHVAVWIAPPAPGRANVTSRAKTPLQRPSPFQGAVWGQSSAYDLSRTSQASIYVFYTPDSGE